jgi:hypothetical protein
MLVEMPDHEIVEIDAAALMSAHLGIWGHRILPWNCACARRQWPNTSLRNFAMDA